MGPSIKKQAKILQRQYKLPKISELTKKFDIDSSDLKSLDELRLEMSDSLFDLAEKIIEPVVAGENFCCMFEQQMLNKEETERLLELYKKIQALKWENNMLSIKPDDKKAAECIKKMWEVHSELEDGLIEICEKFAKEWETFEFKTSNNKESKTCYFG